MTRPFIVTSSTLLFFCLVILLVLSLLWSSKHALHPFLEPCGREIWKSSSVPSVDDEWTVLENAVLVLWRTSPAIGNDRRHPKPTILTQLLKQQDPIVTEDITLCTHISINKWDVLLIQLELWGGPASVAVYLTTPEEIQMFFFFLRAQYERYTKVTFHVVLERGAPPNNQRPWYPHNILRNVALETIESDYFVALDVDFIPSPNAHDRLLYYLEKDNDFRQQLRVNQRMFVLPAFELFPQDGERFATPDMLPLNKTQLIDMVNEQKLVPFRKTGRVGHSLTNFDKWLSLSATETHGRYYYDIPLQGGHRREVWEPYVVAYRPGIHRYWEDFRGYGFDKYSFFIESQLAGYTFAALHDLYCVHLDHPEVPSDDQVNMLERNRVYYNEFRAYLRERYGEQKWLSDATTNKRSRRLKLNHTSQ